jgi:hypothetical protein
VRHEFIRTIKGQHWDHVREGGSEYNHSSEALIFTQKLLRALVTDLLAIRLAAAAGHKQRLQLLAERVDASALCLRFCA